MKRYGAQGQRSRPPTILTTRSDFFGGMECCNLEKFLKSLPQMGGGVA
jgi:hypothetical protein